MDKLRPISLENIRTYSLKERSNKVRIDDFGKPWRTGGDVSPRIKSLLKILAGNDFRMVVNNIA